MNFSTGGPGQCKRHHGETGVHSTWSSSEPVPCQDAETAPLRVVSAEEVAKRRKLKCVREPDVILLSFFDGVASAALICQQICEERNLQWQGILWESDPELRKRASAKFPSALLREDVDKAKAEDIINDLRQIDPKPLPLADFVRENFYFVKRKLARQRVDRAWEVMAAEIASDVQGGRMEGPFERRLVGESLQLPWPSTSTLRSCSQVLVSMFLVASRLPCAR